MSLGFTKLSDFGYYGGIDCCFFCAKPLKPWVVYKNPIVGPAHKNCVIRKLGYDPVKK